MNRNQVEDPQGITIDNGLQTPGQRKICDTPIVKFKLHKDNGQEAVGQIQAQSFIGENETAMQFAGRDDI